MANYEEKAKVVLELCIEDAHEHIVRIEDPAVIPTVGDTIDFANSYGYSAIEGKYVLDAIDNLYHWRACRLCSLIFFARHCVKYILPAIERRIRFYGTLGAERQCFVKIVLRSPKKG